MGHETTVRAIGKVRGLAVHADYADRDASTLRAALQECATAISRGQPVRLLCSCPMNVRCHRDIARARVLHMARAPLISQPPSEQTRPAAMQQKSPASVISSTWTNARMEAGPPPWPVSDPRWCETTACDSRWLVKWPHESRVAPGVAAEQPQQQQQQQQRQQQRQSRSHSSRLRDALTHRRHPCHPSLHQRCKSCASVFQSARTQTSWRAKALSS